MHFSIWQCLVAIPVQDQARKIEPTRFASSTNPTTGSIMLKHATRVDIDDVVSTSPLACAARKPMAIILAESKRCKEATTFCKPSSLPHANCAPGRW